MSSKFIYFILITIILIGCTSSKYEKLIASEMSKEIRHDTIFLGFKFGAPKEHFFEQCKELNSQKIVAQALKNNFVEYFFPKTGKDDETLKVMFWGTFNNERNMTGLKFEFTSAAWSPWNKDAQPPKLIPIVKNKLLEWFPGNDFIAITPKGGDKTFWVKVDGNRRITIAPPDDINDVEVKIDDLRFVLD